MKKNVLTVLLILTAAAIASADLLGRPQEDIMNYEKVKEKVGSLLQGKKYEEAIALYEEALQQFPDKFYEISFPLAQLYMSTGKPGKSLDIFEAGLQKKIVYPIWSAAPYWQPLAGHDSARFKKILAENKRLQAEKTAAAEPGFNIIPPAGYTAGKKYPLFIVLHGWNETMAQPAKYWQTKRLNQDFLLALAQSSQVVGPHTFGWEDAAAGRKDVMEIYRQITAAYSVDKDRIIIAGFSQGGMMAMDIAGGQGIPCAGFVVLHPGGGIPEDFNAVTVKKAGERGLKGAIIMSEQNKSGEEIDKIQETLKQAGIDYRFVVTGTGHWYPADFAQQLDAAIAHIFTEKR